MKCMSCTAAIPPEWVAAINKNECPGCGGQIMNEDSQALLAELAEAMERMPNNPQGLAGWLLSNYRLVKVGEGKPTEKFHTKDNRNTHYESGHNEFAERSGAGKVMSETQAKLKALMKQNPGSPKNAAMQHIANNILEDEEDENYEHQQEQIDMGNEVEYETGDEDYNPPQFSMAKELAKNAKTYSPNGNMSDEDLHNFMREAGGSINNDTVNVLEQMGREKRLKAQEALRSGGFKGSK